MRDQYKERRDLVILAIRGLASSGRGTPPSMREVAEASGVPLSTLHSYIARLEDEGVVRRDRGRHRRLRLA